MPRVDLTNEELELLAEALDSHVYWQLSDDHYRSSGYVMEPGSDDPESAEQIVQCELLADRLRKVAV